MIYAELQVKWVARPRQKAVAHMDDLVARQTIVFLARTGADDRVIRTAAKQTHHFMFVDDRR